MGGDSVSDEELSDEEVQASTGFWKTRLVRLGIATALTILLYYVYELGNLSNYNDVTWLYFYGLFIWVCDIKFPWVCNWKTRLVRLGIAMALSFLIGLSYWNKVTNLEWLASFCLLTFISWFVTGPLGKEAKAQA
jgi:hypothetical protein